MTKVIRLSVSLDFPPPISMPSIVRSTMLSKDSDADSAEDPVSPCPLTGHRLLQVLQQAYLDTQLLNSLHIQGFLYFQCLHLVVLLLYGHRVQSGLVGCLEQRNDHSDSLLRRRLRGLLVRQCVFDRMLKVL